MPGAAGNRTPGALQRHRPGAETKTPVLPREETRWRKGAFQTQRFSAAIGARPQYRGASTGSARREPALWAWVGPRAGRSTSSWPIDSPAFTWVLGRGL